MCGASSMNHDTFRQGKENVLRLWKDARREGEPAWSLRVPILIDGVHRPAVDMGLLASRYALTGSARQVAAALREFAALGVSHVALEVSYSTYPGILETIDIIAGEIRSGLAGG